jgi:hypothetical protein
MGMRRSARCWGRYAKRSRRMICGLPIAIFVPVRGFVNLLRCGKVIPAFELALNALPTTRAVSLAQVGLIARPSAQSSVSQKFRSAPQHIR